MFKVAASKIAHNTTIPSLGGNRDLRPLQDLITAEKSVLISLQRLSVDLEKSADALRIWGAGEGEDLTDILGASQALLSLYAASLSHYASLGHTMRYHLKSIRSREEGFDDLKRRRKALGVKAESAERKLSKMGSEHKNYPTQVETLNGLRAEIRSMDSEIMSEEAYLGDFKRTTTKAWMTLKFGGMLESSEKGTIAAEYGNLIVSEIPEDQTQPGTARSLYYGRPKIENLLSEAQRCISQVAISTGPSSKTPRPSQALKPPESPHFHSADQRGSSGAATEWSPIDPTPANEGHPNYLPPPSGLGTGGFFDQPETPTTATQHAPQLPHFLQRAEPQGRRSLDDFGVNTARPSTHGSTASGHFATFPVKRPTGPLPRPDVDQSFASSVTEALRSSQSPPGTIPSFNTQQGYPHGQPIYAPPPGPPPGMQAQVLEAHSYPEDDASLAYMDEPRQLAQGNDNSGHEQPRQEPHNVAHGGHIPYGGDPHGWGDTGAGLGGDEHFRGRLSRTSDPVPPPPPLESYETQPASQHQEGPQEPGDKTTAQVGLDAAPPPEAALDVHEDNPPPRFQNQQRVPVPALDPGEDERARNVIAAREVGREMEGLGFLNMTSPIALAQLRATGGQSQRSREASPARGRTPPLPPHKHDLDTNEPEAVNNPLRPPPRPWTDGSSQPNSSSSSRWTTPAQSLSQIPPSRSLASSEDQPPSPTLGLPRISTNIPATDSSSRFPSPRLGIGLGNPMTKSTSSLNTQVSSGARTISAAAFKRPQRLGSGGEVGSVGSGPFADTSPLVLKKSSQHPAGPMGLRQRDGSPRGRASREGSPRGSPQRSLPRQTPPPPASLPLPPVPDIGGGGEGEYEYDYFSAYTEGGSQTQTHAQPQGAGNARGYGEGRYATDLEGESLT